MSDIFLNELFICYRPVVRKHYEKMFGKLPPKKKIQTIHKDYTRDSFDIRTHLQKISYIPYEQALKMVEYMKKSNLTHTKNSVACNAFIKLVESKKVVAND